MKRNVTALLLALSMCLSLLSACGSGDAQKTEDPSGAGSAPGSVEQENTEKPETGEPGQEDPNEPEGPTQEPSAANPAGAQALALLQEEYKNGFAAEGERPGHTYFTRKSAFIYDGILYIAGGINNDPALYSTYDIASKKVTPDIPRPDEGTYRMGSDVYREYFIDGKIYCANIVEAADYSYHAAVFDRNGTLQKISEPVQTVGAFFEKGILCQDLDGSIVVLSYDLEKIAEIPNPQRDIEHGLKEDVRLVVIDMLAADGTAYAKGPDDTLYRLNTDTYEWEIAGDAPEHFDPYNHMGICGKYGTDYDGIYDYVTKEYVFEYGELYPAFGSPCYFGGDKYLGYGNGDYRWVSLKDGTMSEPLLFPEGKSVTVVSDTYCVYKDEYGWFLWDYNTGTEETITLFER